MCVCLPALPQLQCQVSPGSPKPVVLCLQALQVFTWLQRAALGLLVFAAVTYAASEGESRAVALSSLISVALSGFAAWRIQIERRKVRFMDYVHAER